MQALRWPALFCALLLTFSSAVAQQKVLELASFPRSALTIASAGKAHTFNVWIADTPDRQSQGLMFVRDLPASEAMLFTHAEPRLASMWMKNTYIPLDLLFIDARGRIVRIFERTIPQSLQTLGASEPVTGVLELRGGEVAKRGIRVGDRVQHPHFRARERRQ